MLTLAAVAMMFTYHPPTAESGPVHQRLNAACDALDEVLKRAGRGEAVPFDEVNTAAFQVAEAVGADVLAFDPHGKVGLAALALARNYANLVLADRINREGIGIAREKLREARMLLNGAVACHFAFLAHQQGLRELAAREHGDALAVAEKLAGAGADEE